MLIARTVWYGVGNDIRQVCDDALPSPTTWFCEKYAIVIYSWSDILG
jgi:hypothetical protein